MADLTDNIGIERRDGRHVREVVDDLPLFDGFGGAELNSLSSYFRAFQANAGAQIFSEGDPGEFLCVVVSGAVEVLKEDQQGVAHVVATVGAGKTLGEMALIDREPRSGTARVARPSELLVLTRESFEKLAGEHPRLALQFTFTIARLLSKRLRLASGMLVDHLG